MRYYYKKDDNSGFLNLKSPLVDIPEGYTQITESEFNQLTNPPLTPEQEAEIERRQELMRCHSRLRELDYIGVKIATGRATREEYAEQIAEMDRLAARINELEVNSND